MSAADVCNCGHARQLAERMRASGNAIEVAVLALEDPRVPLTYKEEILRKLLRAARSMKECP